MDSLCTKNVHLAHEDSKDEDSAVPISMRQFISAFLSKPALMVLKYLGPTISLLFWRGTILSGPSSHQQIRKKIIQGQDWMKHNAGRMHSIANRPDQQLSEATEIYENFAQLLILEAMGDRSLVSLVEHPSGKWNFFQGKGQLTTENYPCDLDTTSLASTVLGCDEKYAHAMMDEMLDYLNPEGISMVYFDHSRPRIDTGICVNTLSFFYSWGRGRDLPKTLSWVLEVLRDRSYIPGGTRYYEPDCFLFFLSRLLQFSSDSELNATLEPLLRERVQERFGVKGDSIALAMRIITADFLGIRDEVDFQALLPLQRDDGGWEIGWMYRYGISRIQIGSRGLATALAIKAITLMNAASEPLTATKPISS